MLDPVEKLELRNKKIAYEGNVPHMYLDTEGQVTIGIGHMMPSAAAAQKVNFLRADGIKASAEEIKNEFDKVKQLGKGKLASDYEKFTKLYVTDVEVNRITDNHLTNFHKELKNLYPGFDSFPKNVRFALFDMIYNLGEPKLRGQFKNFKKAIDARDWAGAAAESSRKGIACTRNQYVAGLLRSEAGVTVGDIPDSCQTPEELKKSKQKAEFKGKKPIPVRIHENKEITSDCLQVFPEYPSYPQSVQIALLDMMSTLGKFAFSTQFPKFIRAIKTRDWLTASRECSRKKVNTNRNQFTAELLKAGYPGNFRLLLRK